MQDPYVSYNFQLVMSLWQCLWDFGSVPAKKTGQGEVDGFQHWAQVAWLLLGFAVESPLLALGGPFLSCFAQMGLENMMKWEQGD